MCGLVKHLADVDDQPPEGARAALGTDTIKDTVNETLRLVAGRERAGQ
jgi:hypothetical protein